MTIGHHVLATIMLVILGRLQHICMHFTYSGLEVIFYALAGYCLVTGIYELWTS